MTLNKASEQFFLKFIFACLPLLLANSAIADESLKRDEKKVSTEDSEKKAEPISVQPKKLSETQKIYLGNKFSQKYHLKGCHFAQIAQPGNIFEFGSCKEAINSNYRACNWCLPKWQKFVRGQIISTKKIQSADAKKSSSQ